MKLLFVLILTFALIECKRKPTKTNKRPEAIEPELYCNAC